MNKNLSLLALLVAGTSGVVTASHASDTLGAAQSELNAGHVDRFIERARILEGGQLSADALGMLNNAGFDGSGKPLNRASSGDLAIIPTSAREGADLIGSSKGYRGTVSERGEMPGYVGHVDHGIRTLDLSHKTLTQPVILSGQREVIQTAPIRSFTVSQPFAVPEVQPSIVPVIAPPVHPEADHTPVLTVQGKPALPSFTGEREKVQTAPVASFTVGQPYAVPPVQPSVAPVIAPPVHPEADHTPVLTVQGKPALPSFTGEREKVQTAPVGSVTGGQPYAVPPQPSVPQETPMKLVQQTPKKAIDPAGVDDVNAQPGQTPAQSVTITANKPVQTVAKTPASGRATTTAVKPSAVKAPSTAVTTQPQVLASNYNQPARQAVSTGYSSQQALQDANTYTNGKFNDLKKQVASNKKEASAGSASAIAFASAPQVQHDQNVMISAGAGTYNGQSGIAVVSSVNVGDSVTLKAGVTGDSQQNFGAGVGVGFGF